TSSPAEIDGVPAAWPLRLRNDDDGQGLNEVGLPSPPSRRPLFPAPAARCSPVPPPAVPPSAAPCSPGRGPRPHPG
ncbi:hypothetical protein ABZ650_17895, partial [Streptomyces griseoviridis]